jgi:hypothetical protein
VFAALYIDHPFPTASFSRARLHQQVQVRA